MSTEYRVKRLGNCIQLQFKIIRKYFVLNLIMLL